MFSPKYLSRILLGILSIWKLQYNKNIWNFLNKNTFISNAVQMFGFSRQLHVLLKDSTITYRHLRCLRVSHDSLCSCYKTYCWHSFQFVRLWWFRNRWFNRIDIIFGKKTLGYFIGCFPRNCTLAATKKTRERIEDPKPWSHSKFLNDLVVMPFLKQWSHSNSVYDLVVMSLRLFLISHISGDIHEFQSWGVSSYGV